MIFNIIVAVIVGLSLIYSLSRGMVREIFSLLSLGASYVIAVRYQAYLGHWLEEVIKNHVAAHLIAFVFLFILSGLIFSMLYQLVAKLLNPSDKLSGLDKLVGGAIGLLKAYVFIVILMFPMQMYPDVYHKLTRGSKLAPNFTQVSNKLINNLDAQGRFIDEMKRIAREKARDKVNAELMKAGKDIKKSIDEPQAEDTDRNTILDDFRESFQIIFNHIISEHRAVALSFVVIIVLSIIILGFRWMADNAGGTMAGLFYRSVAFLGDKTNLSFLQRFGKFKEYPANTPKTNIGPSREPVDDREIPAGARARTETGSVEAEIPKRPALKPDQKLVFISYRRDKGSQMARIVKSEIEKRHYSVFLDVDDIGAEAFDSKLLNEIESAPNFVLILAPGSLDRCVNEDDWLRREIAHAIKTDRNIIPMMFDGFQYPPKELFAKDILELMLQNGVLYSHEYHNATFDKLMRFLKDT